MNEQEFDSRFLRPFVREDAMRADARARRCTSLAVALWGTSDSLERQLRAPHPEIPAGFDLADFRELEKQVGMIMFFSANQDLIRRRFPIPVAAQHPAVWEARREVLRRAIEYLESH